MNTRWNALAVVASIALGTMIWLGPLAVLSLSHIGAAKAWGSASERCGGPDATQCIPADDLVVVTADF
jgi:hypothetical protein